MKACTSWLGIAALGAILVVGAARADDEVVAKLGTVEMRASEVRRLIAAQDAETRAQVEKSPELLARLVRTEVFRRALLAEAKAKGWDKRAGVAEQLERAREQALVASYMNEIARPPASYPSEDELKSAYQDLQGELRAPRQLRLAQIFIADPAPGTAAAKRRMAELARRAREPGADFAALARAESEHKASARANGDAGWMVETELVPEIRVAIAGLEGGEIAGPVRTAAGWHLVKLVEVKAGAVRPFGEARETLVQILRVRRARENERAYLDRLAAGQSLAVNEIALARLRRDAP
jgi:peptidylprolyl isomerase